MSHRIVIADSGIRYPSMPFSLYASVCKKFSSEKFAWKIRFTWLFVVVYNCKIDQFSIRLKECHASYATSTITNDMSSSSSKLTSKDIPSANVKEPLETHDVTALQWWLLCHGIKQPLSWRISQLIDQ